MMEWNRRHSDGSEELVYWYKSLTERQRKRVDEWIKKNPPVDGWAKSTPARSKTYYELSWAYLEMPAFVAGPPDRDRSFLGMLAAYILGGAPWGA